MLFLCVYNILSAPCRVGGTRSGAHCRELLHVWHILAWYSTRKLSHSRWSCQKLSEAVRSDMPAHDIRWTAIFSFVLASHRDLPSLSHVRDWTAMDCNRKSWTLPFAISSTFSCTSAWKCLPNKQVPSSKFVYFVCTFTIHNSEFVCYKTARSSEGGSRFCSETEAL
jgi:hypothetical protein